MTGAPGLLFCRFLHKIGGTACTPAPNMVRYKTVSITVPQTCPPGARDRENKERMQRVLCEMWKGIAGRRKILQRLRHPGGGFRPAGDTTH